MSDDSADTPHRCVDLGEGKYSLQVVLDVSELLAKTTLVEQERIVNLLIAWEHPITKRRELIELIRSGIVVNPKMSGPLAKAIREEFKLHGPQCGCAQCLERDNLYLMESPE